ncbi:MAG: hypothetical protein KGH72_05715 [Candidatus Micrarchaeota archaeon]|nr:hypothetical protein [Candidatus Micrarchaeota archaeon]
MGVVMFVTRSRDPREPKIGEYAPKYVAKMAEGNLATLAQASMIKDAGKYWISTDGISDFVDPKHRFYIDNGDGTFSKVSKEAWDQSDWSVRVRITKLAAKRALSGYKGPLALLIRGTPFLDCRMEVNAWWGPQGIGGMLTSPPVIQDRKENIKPAKRD